MFGNVLFESDLIVNLRVINIMTSFFSTAHRFLMYVYYELNIEFHRNEKSHISKEKIYI